jgi:hypothetical protein
MVNQKKGHLRSMVAANNEKNIEPAGHSSNSLLENLKQYPVVSPLHIELRMSIRLLEPIDYQMNKPCSRPIQTPGNLQSIACDCHRAIVAAVAKGLRQNGAFKRWDCP